MAHVDNARKAQNMRGGSFFNVDAEDNRYYSQTSKMMEIVPSNSNLLESIKLSLTNMYSLL